jgi:hypothetical protein
MAGIVIWQGICYNIDMPYKNIKDRRAAYKRWKERHPNRVKELAKIGKEARSANPERKVCSIKKCDNLGERHHPDYSKPKEIIWLCKYHHNLIHSTSVCYV